MTDDGLALLEALNEVLDKHDPYLDEVINALVFLLADKVASLTDYMEDNGTLEKVATTLLAAYKFHCNQNAYRSTITLH